MYIGDQLIELDSIKYELEDNKQEESDDTENVYPDEGELLVI